LNKKKKINWEPQTFNVTHKARKSIIPQLDDKHKKIKRKGLFNCSMATQLRNISGSVKLLPAKLQVGGVTVFIHGIIDGTESLTLETVLL